MGCGLVSYLCEVLGTFVHCDTERGGVSDFFLYFLHPLCSTGAAHDNTYVVGGTQSSSSSSSSAWWWWWWWWWYPVLTSQQHHGYRVKLLSVCVRSYISEAHRYQASEAKVQSRTISWLKQATSEIFICQIVKETHRPIHRHIIYRHIYTSSWQRHITHSTFCEYRQTDTSTLCL